MRNEKQKAMDRADEWFSKFIRLSHADARGYVKCCTCGKYHHWKNVDCGHFMTRNHQSTRYDEKNVGPQCRSCNSFKGGRQYEMGKWLDVHFGPGTAEEMEFKSKMFCKRNRYDFQVLANTFRERFNNMIRIKKLK